MINILKKNKFLQGTLLITIAGLAGSFFNYLVHPVLMRNLSVSGYGDFQVLNSFGMLLAIINNVILTTTAKETTVLKNKGQEKKLGLFRKQLTLKLFIITGLIFGILCLLNLYLIQILKISSYSAAVIVSLLIVFGPLAFLNKGLLQGLQEFPSLALSNFIDSFFRFVFVLLLVLVLSFGLIGAVSASIISILFSYLITSFLLKSFIPKFNEEKKIYNLKIFFKYSFLVLLVNVGIMFLFNLDIFVAKYILDTKTAGYYASLITIGRIIYFLGGAVPLIMFPVIAGEATKKTLRKYKILMKSIALLFLFTIPVVIFFYLFPEFVIKILAGNKYINVAMYLPYFTISLFLLISIQVLSQYFLALGNKKIPQILLAGIGIEIIILYFNHSSITEIITSVITAFTLILIILIIYLFMHYRVDKRNYIRET